MIKLIQVRRCHILWLKINVYNPNIKGVTFFLFGRPFLVLLTKDANKYTEVHEMYHCLYGTDEKLIRNLTRNHSFKTGSF